MAAKETEKKGKKVIGKRTKRDTFLGTSLSSGNVAKLRRLADLDRRSVSDYLDNHLMKTLPDKAV